jgi:outer membrane protein assembly factor BamB
MRYLILCLSVLNLLFLAGCNTMEHRSETEAKEPLPVLEKTACHPQKLWSNHQSQGIGKSDGKLRLALTPSLVVTADHKGQILALDRETGKLVWRQETKTPITAGPSIDKDLILVASREGYVYAYHVQEGSLVWKAEVTGEVLAPPQSANGVVLVNALDGSVTALSAGDGRVLWRYNRQVPPLVLRRSSSPVMANDQVIVGFANGKIVALQRTDGSLEWEREISEPKGRSDIQRMVDVSADPIVAENTLYAVGYQGQLVALELETGVPRWQLPISSYSGLVLSKNTLYVSDVKGIVWAVEKNKGKVLWKQAKLKGRQLSAPELWGENIVVGDDDGFLHFMSKNDGVLVGRLQLESKGIEAQPKVFDNLLYVLGRSGRITVLKGN